MAQACETQCIPLVLVQSYGLLGVVRLQTPPLPLLYGTGAQSVPDLRLAEPFSGLAALAASIALNDLNDHDHQHIPYPLILIKALELWRQQQQSWVQQT